MHSELNPSDLPTPLALVANRLQITGGDDFANTFLDASYVAEVAIKLLATSLVAGTRKSSSAIAARFDYRLVRADGLGEWDQAIRDLTSHSILGYIDSDLRPLSVWLTQKRTKSADEWAKQAAHNLIAILQLLGLPGEEVPRKLTTLHILNLFVRIRNKTKAHGAVTREFYEQANPRYLAALAGFVNACPINQWGWYHSTLRSNGKVRAIHLLGTSPEHVRQAESASLRPPEPGLVFRTHVDGDLFHCGPLLRSESSCNRFAFVNGNYSNAGVAEFLDYRTGDCQHVKLPEFSAPPAPLPASETEGIDGFDVYGSAFGNLPPRQTTYVRRPKLEATLLMRLKDQNHPIITLHGRGGIGKTSLALQACYELSEDDNTAFEHLIWLSARDLELRPAGTAAVRRHVSNLDSVVRAVGGFFGQELSIEEFAAVLQDPAAADASSILFIFDNFETLDDPRGLQKFLDTHTHLPNKILITSRERAFKADYPVEVTGMEYEEAQALCYDDAVKLDLSRAFVDDHFEELYELTDGHPYVIRVLLGEMSKEKRWISPRSLPRRRGDIVDAVFERSFNKLSEDGRRVFLTAASWRSLIPELAMHVVLGARDIDVESGIEECQRLSLLMQYDISDGSVCFAAPQLASLFAKKKLDGDPDRLVILEDRETLRLFFGPLSVDAASKTSVEAIVERFVAHCFAEIASDDGSKGNDVEVLLERVADEWPAAWVSVGQLREKLGTPRDQVEHAYRRAVEERPYDGAAWHARAEYARRTKDSATRISALISQVEAEPDNVELLRNTALELVQYVDENKADIPVNRRGVYIANVRAHMEKHAVHLDATGLSRLAWLHLLEGDHDGAWKYANMGLAIEAVNAHCLRIVERLDVQGYQPDG